MDKDKIKKTIEYIELNGLKENEIVEICDYYELSNEGRWFILEKYRLTDK